MGMKKRTRLACAVLCGAWGLSALLSGCGSALAAGAAENLPRTVMICYENNPGEPIDLACQKWQQLVEERSGGSLEVKLYPSSQLGSKDNLIDQAVNGDCVVTLANGAFFQDRGVKDFGVVFAPYLFKGWEDLDALRASDWWAEKEQELEDEAGLRILTTWRYGARHTMTVSPVNSVADLHGKKIRVPNNTIQIKGFEALGATPTPMSLGDVYTALQQHTIDGLENPLPVLVNGAYQEVAKYLLLDAHIYDETCWVAGASFLDTLTEEQQALLVDCGEEAGAYNTELLEQTTAEALQRLKEEGVTVTEVSHEDLAAAAASFYEDKDIKSMWSDGLIDRIRVIIGE